MSLGNQIRELRMERSWSQTGLAEAAGLSQGTISRMERGQMLSVSALRRVAAILGRALVLRLE